MHASKQRQPLPEFLLYSPSRFHVSLDYCDELCNNRSDCTYWTWDSSQHSYCKIIVSEYEPDFENATLTTVAASRNKCAKLDDRMGDNTLMDGIYYGAHETMTPEVFDATAITENVEPLTTENAAASSTKKPPSPVIRTAFLQPTTDNETLLEIWIVVFVGFLVVLGIMFFNLW